MRTDRSPRGGQRAPAPAESDQATRQRVIDAATACILERGFYRASTNEIARRAGVSWGVIQHYFGTREALMVAVLQDRAGRFLRSVEDVDIQGDTAADRVEQLLDVLSAHYGQPEFLVSLQVLLNLDHDPRTSTEVRRTMRELAEHSHDHLRRLLRQALGPAASTPDLATTVFLVVRGFGISQQLQDAMAYDSVAPAGDRVARQRRLLARMLAPFLERAEDRSS